MSEDYYSVVGIGVRESDITWGSLTRLSKDKIIRVWKEGLDCFDFCDDDGNFIMSLEDIDGIMEDHWFEENLQSHNLWSVIGLDTYTGSNYFRHGGYRGIGLNLNTSSLKEDVDLTIQEFKSIVNLDPIIFNDVLVYWW